MASNITHYFFGKHLAPTLPMEARKVVEKYPAHFLLGNQGPDLFFYHITSPKGKVGSLIHSQPFDHLLLKNRQWIQTKPVDAPTWSYFLGLIAHFSLDIAFHPYIDRIEKRISLDHMTIEREFDRRMLQLEGYSFGSWHERTMIPRPKAVAEAILPIYSGYGVSIHDIRQAISSFRMGMTFFHVDTEADRLRKLKLLRAFALDEKFGGMLMQREGSFESQYITSPVLLELMELAYPIARDGISAVYGEEEDYPEFFHLNFSGR